MKDKFLRDGLFLLSYLSVFVLLGLYNYYFDYISGIVEHFPWIRPLLMGACFLPPIIVIVRHTLIEYGSSQTLEKVFGDDHLFVAQALEREDDKAFGDLMNRSTHQDSDQVEQLIATSRPEFLGRRRRILEIKERALGKNHFDLAVPLIQLAAISQDEEDLLARALSICELQNKDLNQSSFGYLLLGHKRAAIDVWMYGFSQLIRLRCGEGNYNKAGQLAEQAFAVWESSNKWNRWLLTHPAAFSIRDLRQSIDMCVIGLKELGEEHEALRIELKSSECFLSKRSARIK